jgi:hypothetical protein
MVHGWHHRFRFETHSATSGWNHMTWSEEQWSPTHRDFTSERTGISLPSSLATWCLLRGEIHHIGYTPHECLQAKLLMGTMCDCSHISRILHGFICPHGTNWQIHSKNLSAIVYLCTLITTLHLRLCGFINDLKILLVKSQSSHSALVHDLRWWRLMRKIILMNKYCMYILEKLI